MAARRAPERGTEQNRLPVAWMRHNNVQPRAKRQFLSAKKSQSFLRGTLNGSPASAYMYALEVEALEASSDIRLF